MRDEDKTKAELIAELAQLRAQRDRKIQGGAQRYQSLFENTPAPTFIWEHRAGEFVITSFNKAAGQLTKEYAARFVGSTAAEIYPDRPDIIENLHRCYKTQSTIRQETPYIARGTGDERYIIFTYGFALPNQVIMHVNDVTERKQAEVALLQSQTRFQKLLGTISDYVWSADIVEGEVVYRYYSPIVEKLTGYPPEYFMTGVAAWLDTIHPEDRARVARDIGREFVGEIVEHEYRIIRRDGVVRWLRGVTTPTQDNSGRVIRLDGVVSDITERKETEEELKKRNQFIETILDNLPIGLAVNYMDDGVATYMNREFEQIYGWPREKITDIDRFFTYVYPDPAYRRQIQKQIMSDVEFGDPKQMNWEGIEITRQDGSKRIVAAKNIPLFEQNLMISTVQDITERRQVEDALHLSNRRLQILHQIDQAILTAQSPQEIANAVLPQLAQLVVCQGAHMSLYDPTQAVFENVATYPQRDAENDLIQRLPLSHTLMDVEALRAGKIHHIEDYQAIPNLPPQLRAILTTSDIRSALAAPLLVHNELIGILGLGRKGPGRFAAEEIEMVREVADLLAIAIRQTRLLESERLARHIAEVLNAANVALSRTLNLDEILDLLLKYLERLVPYDSASVMLREDEWRVAVRAMRGYERWADVEKTRQVALDIDPETTPLTYKLLTQKTSVVLADTRQDPYWDFNKGAHVRNWMGVPLIAGDQVIGLYSVDKVEPDFFTTEHVRLVESLAAQGAAAIQNARLYDQTQRHSKELAQRVEKRTAALSAANAQLARATRLKDEFLASMSHELRTPLNAILGMAEILRSNVYGTLNEEQRKSAQLISESGQHLLDLITDILDLSKIEAGELELQINPVVVADVCQASMRFVSRIAQHKQIETVFSVDQNVTTILADERRLKQILVNLVSNAVKFTPEGGKMGLEVSGDEDRAAVLFSVWDTGIGIAEEYFERLFKPFVQIDSSLSRGYEGTGLGLALVSRLTELHGGSVSFTSTVNEGSRFTVSLPWHLPQGETGLLDTPVAEDDPEALWPKTDSGQLGTVLLAEDNEANIAVLQDFLQTSGYQVFVARDGAEALMRVQEEAPDIILMDVQMPEIDGLEATRRLRAMPRFANIPIIGLTALTMPGDQESCMAAGMNGYLSKPVSLKVLGEMIESHLQTASG